MKKFSSSLLMSLVILVLLLGLGYTVYVNFFKNEKNVAKGANLNDIAFDFTLQDLHGNEVSLSDFRGKGIILNFWATYCPPCKKEMPHLNNIYKEYKDKGIEVLAVNANEPRVIIKPFVQEYGLHFPILLDRTGSVVDQYDILNIPVTFFINEEGEIVEKSSGELTVESIRSSVKHIIPK
ncbi:thiol-disulfide oxidoreductase ResA [Priestia filamentosa]|uniref:thiol-disulfide oxidoreductase ResA n=1 Tax=Priestia filamentosa TaxID=1402861 RepID=UPI003D2859D8